MYVMETQYIVVISLGGVSMKIIKRNGSEEGFDVSKIVAAITKANAAVDNSPLSKEQISDIADYVEYKCKQA